MQLSKCAAICLAAVSLGSLAVAQNKTMTLKQWQELYDKAGKAFERKDDKWLLGFIASDYKEYHPDGKLQPPPDFKAMFAQTKTIRVTFKVLSVQVQGNTILVKDTEGAERYAEIRPRWQEPRDRANLDEQRQMGGAKGQVAPSGDARPQNERDG